MGQFQKTMIAFRRWMDVGQTTNLRASVDDIFFSSSNTQNFATAEEREAFHECWLGRYREFLPEHFWLAIDHQEEVVGYLAGAQENPFYDPLFIDHAYYSAFSSVLDQYPAHFHINVEERYRGAGVGAQLVDVFARDCWRAGLSGVHVVTAKGARNVRFYERERFFCRAEVAREGQNLVLLGRTLR